MRWQTLIPATKGTLPNGQPVHRTDPSGNPEADIAIMGVYPAAKVKLVSVGEKRKRMNLPVQVERTSFEDGVSASGRDLDDNYLAPLGLTRDQVLLLDLLPYFLANTRGKRGRTMADNLKRYERLKGEQLGIDARPSPAKTVQMAREMPGNLARLADILGRGQPEVLLTLGVEVAAFVRDETVSQVSKVARELFYQEPVRLDVVGAEVDVVHLAHPGILMAGKSGAWWRARHQAWCTAEGQRLVGGRGPGGRGPGGGEG